MTLGSLNLLLLEEEIRMEYKKISLLSQVMQFKRLQRESVTKSVLHFTATLATPNNEFRRINMPNLFVNHTAAIYTLI